jgi:hypothetical protein
MDLDADSLLCCREVIIKTGGCDGENTVCCLRRQNHSIVIADCGEVGIAYIGRYRVSIHRVLHNIAINPKALTLVRSYHLVITDPLSALLSL